MVRDSYAVCTNSTCSLCLIMRTMLQNAVKNGQGRNRSIDKNEGLNTCSVRLIDIYVHSESIAVMVLGTSMSCHPFLWKPQNFDCVLYCGKNVKEQEIMKRWLHSREFVIFSGIFLGAINSPLCCENILI